MKWPINSDCETVHIISTLFKTYHSKDKVTIDGIEYYGDRKVNQIVSKNFTIYFASNLHYTDKGFILNWSCTEWGEWNKLDGTCNEEKRPIINGTETVGLLKYRKSNSTCSKLIYFLFIIIILMLN